jgi:hypothetical protein
LVIVENKRQGSSSARAERDLASARAARGAQAIARKLLDIEFSIRGILRWFGLKKGIVTRKSLEQRARELSAGQVMLETVVGAMLAARTTLQTE